LKNLLAAAQSLVSGSRLALALLIELDFASGTLRLATTRSDVEDLDSPPNTFTGVGTLGQVEPVESTVGDIPNLSFTLSGVPTSVIAIALGEQVRGRGAKLYVGLMNPDTEVMEDVVLEWSGVMSTMSISQQGGLATVRITAEHRGVLFNRPRPLRYTDAEQQRLFPGDRCLEYIVSQSQAQDVWPAASFFRK
jgi:hypothetical protein